MRAIVVVILSVSLLSCVTATQHNTPSGRPEAVIAVASSDQVKTSIVNRMLSAGYRITKDTSFEIAFDKSVTNIAAVVLLGSRYDSQPNTRISYSIAQMGDGVRVVADLAVITNPGSAFERRMEVNQGPDSVEIQKVLDSIRVEFDPTSPIATARAKGNVLGVMLMRLADAKARGVQIAGDDGLYVASVSSGGVAERAGVTKGDVIISYAGKRVETESDLATVLAATKPGSVVSLQILRNGSPQSVSIKFDSPKSSPKSKKQAA